MNFEQWYTTVALIHSQSRQSHILENYKIGIKFYQTTFQLSRYLNFGFIFFGNLDKDIKQ